MRSMRLLLGLLVCLVLQVSAGIVTYNDPAAFDAAGVIVYNSNFDDFSSGFSPVGATWWRGGVTYMGPESVLVVVGTQTTFAPLRNVLAYNMLNPLTGTVDSGYDMFGFQLAVIGDSNPVDVNLYTNIGSYSFTGISVPNASVGFNFWGFVLTGGEEFTGFSLSPSSIYTGPAITDVAVGDIPEPSTIGLTLIGLAGLGAGLLKRKK